MFGILTSDVTDAEIIAAGYPRGIERRKLDDSEVLIQGPDPLPASLDSFVVIKDQTEAQIFLILRGIDWHADNSGGI